MTLWLHTDFYFFFYWSIISKMCSTAFIFIPHFYAMNNTTWSVIYLNRNPTWFPNPKDPNIANLEIILYYKSEIKLLRENKISLKILMEMGPHTT